ncbi:MAG TPA: hypothetical protein VGB91_11155 [Rhizomicrobium sp.]
MAVPKFALACLAAAVAGGACAGFARDSAAPAQDVSAPPLTPLAAIAQPAVAFRGVAVRLASGRAIAHVAAVATDGQGRASRIQIVFDDLSARTLWLGGSDLAYSRAGNCIVARNIPAPAMTLAQAR